MSNGKVRTSKIKKGISRTISTARYEGLVIHDEIEEEVEWSSIEERQRKIQNWETVLLQNFKQLHDRILSELNLSHKRAYFKNYLEEKDERANASEVDMSDSLDVVERAPLHQKLSEFDGLDVIG